jgi:hypothetical protein
MDGLIISLSNSSLRKNLFLFFNQMLLKYWWLLNLHRNLEILNYRLLFSLLGPL